MPFSCVDDGVVVWTRRFRERGGSLRPLKCVFAARTMTHYMLQLMIDEPAALDLRTFRINAQLSQTISSLLWNQCPCVDGSAARGGGGTRPRSTQKRRDGRGAGGL